jgi:hypothetical protein
MGGGGKKQQAQPQYIPVYQEPTPDPAALAAQTAENDKLTEEERLKKNRRGRSSTLLTQDEGGVSNVGQKTR